MLFCSRFEPATADPVLQDHWSLYGVSMAIKAPLRPLAVRTPTVRAHFQKSLPPLVRAQRPATFPLISSKRLVSSVSSLPVNFTASMFSTLAPQYHTRYSRRPCSGPCLHGWWLLRKLLELAGFLRIVFRPQHHDRIVGCTGFPTDSHNNI